MQHLKEAYIETIVPVSDEWGEVVIALLSELGYEGFEEGNAEVKAYRPANTFDAEGLAAKLGQLPIELGAIRHNSLEAQNYNQLWETAYESIEVGTFCQIVPSFKEPKPGFTHTLRIDPQMSFGTGHHETTRLVIQHLSQIDCEGISVLDMGCGTGVLGILAAKMGANSVLGIDIDPWSYENARENVKLNQVGQMNVRKGDRELIPDQTFDLLLANINRNVLLADMATYAQHLSKAGQLIVSGFLESDERSLERAMQAVGLTPTARLAEGQWLSIRCTN
ncbi:MAG: 50S ribosomal protein L11 methyltransferase [Bacteroidota bacterium]